MSASGVGNLEFIDGIMDHRKYIEILKRNLRSSAEKLGILENFIYYEDKDPKHTAPNTKLWLLYNTPKCLNTPPQSPDVNPIEHLWDVLERRIRKRTITSKETLKTALKEEWQSILPNITEKLVESMPRRLCAVIKAKGYPTKY